MGRCKGEKHFLLPTQETRIKTPGGVGLSVVFILSELQNTYGQVVLQPLIISLVPNQWLWVAKMDAVYYSKT
jgi:hypothetical protein